MDPIYTYKMTKRKINMSFDVPSANSSSAKENYDKMNTLLDSMYPIFDEKNSDMYGSAIINGPPLFRINFSNYVDNTLGVITSLSFKPELENGFFVITGSNTTDPMIYPKLFKVNISFDVIHDNGNSDFNAASGQLTVTPPAQQGAGSRDAATTSTDAAGAPNDSTQTNPQNPAGDVTPPPPASSTLPDLDKLIDDAIKSFNGDPPPKNPKYKRGNIGDGGMKKIRELYTQLTEDGNFQRHIWIRKGKASKDTEEYKLNELIATLSKGK